MSRTEIVDKLMGLLNCKFRQREDFTRAAENMVRALGQIDVRVPNKEITIEVINKTAEDVEKRIFVELETCDDELSDEELAQVLAFYASDIGKKWLEIADRIRQKTADMHRSVSEKFGHQYVKISVLRECQVISDAVHAIDPDMPEADVRRLVFDVLKRADNTRTAARIHEQEIEKRIKDTLNAARNDSPTEHTTSIPMPYSRTISLDSMTTLIKAFKECEKKK